MGQRSIETRRAGLGKHPGRAECFVCDPFHELAAHPPSPRHVFLSFSSLLYPWWLRCSPFHPAASQVGASSTTLSTEVSERGTCPPPLSLFLSLSLSLCVCGPVALPQAHIRTPAMAEIVASGTDKPDVHPVDKAIRAQGQRAVTLIPHPSDDPAD